jgi:ankyrin repeat protein
MHKGQFSSRPKTESNMSTTTTTIINDSDKDQSMTDSGISATSLRLTTNSDQPMVRMPNTAITMPTNGSSSLQDSGICSDLMMRLSLNGSTSNNAAAWKEYYEPDEDGDVQLHLAVAAGLADVVDALVRMAPSPDYLSMQNYQGYSPLHIAVLQNQPTFVRRLVIAGARLDYKDREGNTPLHLTARRGHVECAEALLRPVAVHEAQGRVLPQQADVIDQRNVNGEHCVHLASMGGHMAFLQFLSWNGADMNALECRAGRSALHLAVGARNLPLIHCLVEPRPRGCGVNPDLVDWYGRTAHQVSRLNCQAEISAYLGPRTPSSTHLSASWLEESESEDGFVTATAQLVNSSA